MKKRDYQRQKVYDFNQYIQNNYNKYISQKEASAVVNQIFKDYEYDLPWAITHHVFERIYKGKLHNIATSARCFGPARVINIPPAMRNLSVIIHEATHLLADWNGSKHGHRPKFVSILMDLYEYYMGIDRVWMEGLATRYGVDFNYKGYIPQRMKNSRKYRYAA